MRTRIPFLLVIFVFSVSTVATSGCGLRQTTRSPQERIDGIAAKLAEAERLGARDCMPRQLAHATAELDMARHEAQESHYGRHWVDLSLADAEKKADELLNLRQLASKTPFRCLSRRSQDG